MRVIIILITSLFFLRLFSQDTTSNNLYYYSIVGTDSTKFYNIKTNSFDVLRKNELLKIYEEHNDSIKFISRRRIQKFEGYVDFGNGEMPITNDTVIEIIGYIDISDIIELKGSLVHSNNYRLILDKYFKYTSWIYETDYIDNLKLYYVKALDFDIENSCMPLIEFYKFNNGKPFVVHFKAGNEFFIDSYENYLLIYDKQRFEIYDTLQKEYGNYKLTSEFEIDYNLKEYFINELIYNKTKKEIIKVIQPEKDSKKYYETYKFTKGEFIKIK